MHLSSASQKHINGLLKNRETTKVVIPIKEVYVCILFECTKADSKIVTSTKWCFLFLQFKTF